MEIIKGKTEALPKDTGYDESRIEVLDKKFQNMVERKLIHGASYCISHKGKVIASGAVGEDNGAEAGTLMQPDTVFGVASITKTFTATAIMQLVEDGLMRLDTPVGEILPQFARKPFDDIQVWHLLTHTSGLYPDENCFPEAAPKSAWELICEAEKLWDKTGEFDWISAGISGGLRVPVGTQWQYSSFGFTILGEIISKVSGQDVHEYIEEHIARRLSMKDSGFCYTKEAAGRSFYWNEEGKQILGKIALGELDGRPRDGSIWDKIPDTGGGLHATAYDLVRFGNAFVYGGRFDGARLLGRKAVEKMSTIQLHHIPDYCWGAREENRLYGVGFDMRQGPAYTYSEGTIMHEGAGACSLDIDPREELVAAWFVPFNQVENGWSAEPLYNIQNIIWSGLI